MWAEKVPIELRVFPAVGFLMVKAKRKTKRGKGNDGVLETLLRFEIIVVLFSLIGLYYFLSFSPIRMPAEPLVSPPQKIAALPPQSEPQVQAGSETGVGQPAAGSGAGQVTVVAELPAAKPLVASVAVTNVENASQSGESEPIAASDPVETVGESGVGAPALAKPKLPQSPPDKISVETPVSEPRNQSVSAVSPPVSATDLPVPVTAAPHPHPAPVPPVKKSQPLTLSTSTVVVGDYVLKADVQESLRKLESLDFTVRTETVRRPTPMYRVYLGTFPRHKKALEIMGIVRKKGDDPFLQAVSGGYNVVIGSFYLRSSVVAWENMYHAAGFEPKVQEITLQMPHTLLILDGPEIQSDPNAVLTRLRAAGFPDSHLK